MRYRGLIMRLLPLLVLLLFAGYLAFAWQEPVIENPEYDGVVIEPSPHIHLDHNWWVEQVPVQHWEYVVLDWGEIESYGYVVVYQDEGRPPTLEFRLPPGSSKTELLIALDKLQQKISEIPGPD